MTHVEAGFSERVISPERGISLAGYFNNRFNRGVHDDLYTKAMVLSAGDARTVLIVADNVMIISDVVEDIRRRVCERTGIPEHNVFIQATHTHNAPVLKTGTWVDFSPAYREFFVEQSVEAVCEAADRMQPVTFSIAEGEERSVAFCRRFIMRDGTVATNPPKDSPDIVGPEGGPDYYFGVLVASDLSGKIVAVLAHCTNHVDTIGGDLVSSDWPGVLCRHVAESLDSRPLVFLLNGMAGNVNHIDLNNPSRQSSFEEADRIGRIYGETAMRLIRTELQPLEVADIGVGLVMVELPRVRLAEEELRETAETLAITPISENRDTLHSVDLAKGNSIVAALFAKKKLEFAQENLASETVEVGGMRIGDLLMVGLPFEPFSEIAMQIRARSPFKHTFTLELLNGSYGYVGTREAAERPGGMETLGGIECLRRFLPEASDRLVDATIGLAESLTGSETGDKE